MLTLTCDDDDGGGDDDGIAVDVEVFTVALGRHSGSTFHRRGLSGAAVGWDGLLGPIAGIVGDQRGNGLNIRHHPAATADCFHCLEASSSRS